MGCKLNIENQKKKMQINYNSIGIIETPFEEREGMPIQPKGAKDIKGKIVLNQEFTEGLKDLEEFSHVILIYHFHENDGYKLTVKPFLDKNPHGLFSTRAPKRPNQIGLSVVKLEKIEENIIHVSGIDVLNKTPLLDIKPYVKDFDFPENSKHGWYDKSKKTAETTRADKRFL